MWTGPCWRSGEPMSFLVLCVDWRWVPSGGPSAGITAVFLITLYTVVYFLVTRFFRFRQWYLDLFLVTGMLVCGFGITDYFRMDLLHFKAELSADQHATFVSTFGNINTYTVYVGAVLAVSMTLFTLDKDWRKRIWYFAAMMVSSVAIIMGTSDNAYLTLGALLGFLPIYLFRTWSGIRRYLMAAAGFFTAAWIVEWANVKYADKVLGIDSLFTMFVQYEHFKEIVLALWIAAAVADGTDGPEKGRKGPDRQMALLCLAGLSGRHCGRSHLCALRRQCGGKCGKVRGHQ